MKAASVKELKDELSTRPAKELLQLCLRLSRFKKENKELLTYLLFESGNEADYIQGIKEEMDEAFEQINTRSIYLIKKSVSKVLRNTRKYIRYSLNKETEVDLLIYFCRKLSDMTPPINRSTSLQNIYFRQIESIRKKIAKLHEDLQYDYNLELDALGS